MPRLLRFLLLKAIQYNMPRLRFLLLKAIQYNTSIYIEFMSYEQENILPDTSFLYQWKIEIKITHTILTPA